MNHKLSKEEQSSSRPCSPQIDPEDARVVRVLRSRTAKKERKGETIEQFASKKARPSRNNSLENSLTSNQWADRNNHGTKERLSDLLNKGNARKLKEKIKRNVPDSFKNHLASRTPKTSKQPTDLKTVMEQYNRSVHGGSGISATKEIIPPAANSAKRNDSESPSKPVSKNEFFTKTPIRQKVRIDVPSVTQQHHRSNTSPSRICHDSARLNFTKKRKVEGKVTFSHSALSATEKPEHFSTNPNDYVSKYTNVARRVSSTSTKRKSNNESFSKKFNTGGTEATDSYSEAHRWQKFRLFNRKKFISLSAIPDAAPTSRDNEDLATKRKSFSRNFQYDSASTTKRSRSKRKRLRKFISRLLRK